MGTDTIGDLLDHTITTIFMMSAPVLFAGLAVGFVISIFQAATQINEVTLVFIPKMFITGLVLWITGDWLFEQLVMFYGEIGQALAVAHGAVFRSFSMQARVERRSCARSRPISATIRRWSCNG